MRAPEVNLTRNLDLSARYAAAVDQMYNPWNVHEKGFDYGGRQMGKLGVNAGPKPGNKYFH